MVAHPSVSSALSSADASEHLLTAEEAAVADVQASAAIRPIERIAVIGAGTMGSAIAVSFANAGLSVDLLEQSHEASEAGAVRVHDLYQRLLKSGRIDENEAALRLARIKPTIDWLTISKADLIVEAAFEDMAVKRSIFETLDGLAKPDAILATNTSYLNVDEIADATVRPGRVVGLHFFSPAHIMRLVEVVRASKTEPEVLASVVALGRRIGKLPVVAGVCDGFIGNRIFAVYRRHAEYLLEDGASPAEIDEAVRAYGFAMGPFAVSDMSGLDIAWAMRKRRASTRDPSERYVRIADLLCEAGRLGRKTGKGWYDYLDGKAVPSPEADLIIRDERARQGKTANSFRAEAIQLRLLSVIVNEAARVLEEGISARPSDIDLVFVNGYGFPKTKGGPLFAADQLGLQVILDEINAVTRSVDPSTRPSSLLVRLAAEDKTFSEFQQQTN
jgi:3-hydroxyacyl-CoA dehydrogenase